MGCENVYKPGTFTSREDGRSPVWMLYMQHFYMLNLFGPLLLYSLTVKHPFGVCCLARYDGTMYWCFDPCSNEWRVEIETTTQQYQPLSGQPSRFPIALGRSKPAEKTHAWLKLVLTAAALRHSFTSDDSVNLCLQLYHSILSLCTGTSRRRLAKF